MKQNPLFIYNTLTNKKEKFEPLEKELVKMYVCGITPYDDTHLGHARCYVTFDIIARYLEYKGFKVNYIQNVTDIDDKIIKRAQEDKDNSKPIKIKCKELTEKYFREYVLLMNALNVKEPTMFVKATETIGYMQEVIQTLIKKGVAYEIDGDVYFSVRKFNDYGKLSGRNINDMRSGSRVEIDEHKEDPLDFVLWKKAKVGEPSWDSPWGEGRPGWHIECSAMSLKILNTQTLDIHGGGQDLIFPHHENEIAQSETYTGKPFARYWIHNGFVMVNKEKMSKSLGNFWTLKDIFAKYDRQAVRLFLLSQHYRSPIDFSDDKLEAANNEIIKFKRLSKNREFYCQKIKEKEEKSEEENLSLTQQVDSFLEKFMEAMDDDFNTAVALSCLYELINYANKKMDKQELNFLSSMDIETKLYDISTILGLPVLSFIPKGFDFLSALKPDEEDEELIKLIGKREQYRQQKKWKEADEIRQEIEKKGVILEDTPVGTKWTKK